MYKNFVKKLYNIGLTLILTTVMSLTPSISYPQAQTVDITAEYGRQTVTLRRTFPFNYPYVSTGLDNSILSINHGRNLSKDVFWKVSSSKNLDESKTQEHKFDVYEVIKSEHSKASQKTTYKKIITHNILDDYTIFAVYGRIFALPRLERVAGILGSLGFYRNFHDFWDGKLLPYVENNAPKDILSIQEEIERIDNINGDKGVIPAIDIVVYSPSCHYKNGIPRWYPNHVESLLRIYGDTNLVEGVIKPALEKGVFIILDHQLGPKSVTEGMKEIINDGYLIYPNVHIAFDPEWHIYPEEKICNGRGHVGKIDANDLNEALVVLEKYLNEINYNGEKIVVIHQFRDYKIPGSSLTMIEGKEQIVNPNPKRIKIVFDADGVGNQCLKLAEYNGIQHETYYKLEGVYPGIKYFPDFNPFTRHTDKPPILTPEQLLGIEDISLKCPFGSRLSRVPSLIIRN